MVQAAATLPSRVLKAPSLKGHRLFGHLPLMRSDPLGLLQRSARECGDVSFLRLVFPIHLLANPSHVEIVLQSDRQKNFEKGKLYDRVKPLVGEGLLTSDGDFWFRQRRLAQPAFHRQRLSAFAADMTRVAADVFESWRPYAAGNRTFDLAAEMMRLTLRAVGLTMLGVDLDQRSGTVSNALPTVLTILNERFQQVLFLPFLPTPQNIRFNRALGQLERLVGDIITDRRTSGGPGNDLLTMFMEARDEDGQAMNAKQLRDEVMTMLLAGHETTSNALSWAAYLLALHPEKAALLRAEVDSVLEGRTPTFDDLPKLRYTEMILKEAMRLYPPAWLMGRRVVKDDEIGGYRLPAGSVVFLCPYVTHRHPGYWDKPDAFEPERFSHERSTGRPRYAFFPFSGGPRACIGDRFAMMEMQLVLPMLMQRYILEMEAGQRVEPDPSVTLRPKNGVPMRIRER